MNNAQKMGPGQVVTIRGGKYDGHGARVCKVDHDRQKVEVMIAGRVVVLGFERVGLSNGKS